MLEKLNTPGYETISAPSPDAVEVLQRVKAATKGPIVAAEVGVGIGATTIEFLKVLGGSGELHLFDREPLLSEVIADLQTLPTAEGITFVNHGNESKMYASYAWELATMARRRDRKKLPVAMFDFAYLDGAHTFHHDAAAMNVLKRMIKPGGYLVIDDMTWSFNGSASANPKNRPALARDYTAEQLKLPHMALVVDVFLRHDIEFEQVFLTDDPKPIRAVFRRLTRAELDRKIAADRFSRAKAKGRRGLGKVKRRVLKTR